MQSGSFVHHPIFLSSGRRVAFPGLGFVSVYFTVRASLGPISHVLRERRVLNGRVYSLAIRAAVEDHKAFTLHSLLISDNIQFRFSLCAILAVVPLPPKQS